MCQTKKNECTSSSQGLITPVQMRPTAAMCLWCCSSVLELSIWESRYCNVKCKRIIHLDSAADECSLNGQSSCCNRRDRPSRRRSWALVSCQVCISSFVYRWWYLDCFRERRWRLLSRVCVQCSGMKDGGEEMASLIQQMHQLWLLRCGCFRTPWTLNVSVWWTLYQTNLPGSNVSHVEFLNSVSYGSSSVWRD